MTTAAAGKGQQTGLAEALAIPEKVTFAGKEWTALPLDFNDLGEAEQRFGNLETMDLDKITTQRYLLWLLLRKADPDLSAEEREAGQYRLTELQVGRMFTLDKLPEVGEFLQRMLMRSGLVPDPGGVTTLPNAPAAA